MKNMKRMFVAAVVAMAVITGVALNTMDTLAVMAEDGFAVPADSGLSRLLSTGDGPAVSLVNVGYDDVVYSSLTGYYVGEKRASIDRSFPIYINSGTGLRFLDEEIWLVSAEIDLMRTYEGLYLSDGYTYNSDLGQADTEEFVFLALQNKLFMNAQAATFENRVTTHDIPSNSILAMTESSIRWYYLDNNALVYAEEGSVFDAKLTVGSHTYDYASLLRALDLLEKAIHLAENNRPPDDLTKEIDEILNGGGENRRDPTPGEVRPGEAAEGVAPGGANAPGAGASGDTQAPEEGGEGEDGTQDPSEFDPDASQNGQGGENQPNAGSSTRPGGTGGDTSQGSGSASKPGSADGESGSTGDNPSDPENGGSGSAGGDDGSGAGSGSGSAGTDGSTGAGAAGSDSSSGGNVDGDQNAGDGSGNSDGSGGGQDGDTSGDLEGDQGDDREGEKGDGSGGSGEENPNPNPNETIKPNPDMKPKPTEPMEYQDPVVELEDMEAWTYALGGYLDINDPYGAIQKGVKVAIYRRLAGSNTPSDTITGADGKEIKVYSAKDNEGKSTIVRKTFVGSQTIALSPIPPDTEFYVQFYYRYTEETDRKPNEDGTWNLTFKRCTSYSDFYQLKTPKIEGLVEAIQADWRIVFAGQESAMELDNFTIANTSDYNPELTGDNLDFSNFKKDSLPYIHRMEYTLTPLDDNGRPSGASVTLSAGSSVMNKAKLPGGTVFLSSTPKLDSNTRYSVSVSAKDRWDNQLPLKIAGPNGTLTDSGTWGGTIFTRKATPTVTIAETANVTDKLTVKVTISDPDGALAIGEDGKTLPLSLTATNTRGDISSIYGHWVAVNGRVNTDGFGSELTSSLELPEPANGKTYELTLESLAFAQLYNIQIHGSYDPQPTAAGASETGSLSRVKDQLLGNMRSYTASLASGNVNFNSGVVNLLDTSGTIQMTMNNRTTVDILPLVDEFRFFLSEKETGKLVSTVTLKMSELDVDGKFEYDKETNSVILYQGGPTEPTIRLEGAESVYIRENNNPWQAMLLKKQYDENRQEDVLLPVMTLAIDIPTDTMRTSTRHEMRMESVVIKSGIEYQIPTALTVTEFTTRKIQPKLHYDDLFIAGDVVEYLDLWIEDPDGTINDDDGLVYAYLYFLGESEGDKGTRLQAVELHANKDPQRLRFEGLIPGAHYSLRFIAKSFNDAEGFTNQKYEWTLWEHNFIGGSFLTGNLNLVGLDFHARTGMTDGQVVYRITGQELQEELRKSEEAGTLTVTEWQGKGLDSWANNSSDRYMSPLIPIDGTTIHFLHLDGYIPDTAADTNVDFRFYKENAKTPTTSGVGWKDIGWANTVYETSWVNISYSVNTRDGCIPVVAVPEDAKYFRIWINGREYAKQNGFTLLGYTQDKGENYCETYAQHGATLEVDKYNDQVDGSLREGVGGWRVIHMLPVKPGEIYVGQMNGVGYNLYSAEKGYMGRVNTGTLGLFRVPQGVYYISTAYNTPTSKHYLYRLSTVDEAEGYDARVDVSVEDTQGYLNNINTPWVILRLYRSDSIQQPSYGSEPCELEQKVILVPKDPEVRADKSQWSTYRGSWIPEEGNAEGVMRLLKERLTADTKYKLTLSADYKGSLVVLDTIEFQTDGAYDTIRNNEEMRKILRNPYGNFLVIDDFEHYLNLNAHITVNGTLDFQGHVVTRRADASFGSYPYLITYNNGVVRNLVYDYPGGMLNYTNSGTVVYYNYANGLLENVIVRTQTTVHVTNSSYPLLCCSNYGHIRNFIVKLGGDLRVHANTWNLGGIFYANIGVIENGYVYTDSTHGVLLYPNPAYTGNPYYGGLVCYNYHQAVIQNVYTIYDTWFARPESPAPVNYSRTLVGWYDAIGEVLDSYHVGEFYVYSAYADGGDKTYNNRVSDAVRLTVARSQNMNRNLSYFTDYKYAAHENTPRYIYQKPIKGLRDVEWQTETLGDAFDTEGCVPMGFYPRLKTLPNELQKYQEYIPLPSRSEGEVPVPISDGWAPNRGAPKNESGYVRFVFQNDKGYTIQSLTASTGTGTSKRDTLELTIIDQSRTDDGLWEVIVEAKAIDYLSYYTITDMTYLRGSAAFNTALSYRTQNIEFWKEVSDTNEWNQINAKMNWNYRVVRNIDFKSVQTPAFMTIDGNTTALASTYFSGKIDGQMYTLSNINLANVSRPWLFYGVSNGGTVKNLIFDNLTITAAADTPKENARTGLIRELNNTTVENVHVRNSEIKGVGYIGSITSYQTTGGSVIGCSAADTTLADLGSSAAVRIGGLVGHGHWYGSIRSSYVRNVTIDATKSPVVYQAGGIIGYSENVSVIDCYATGSITAKANYVGGIIGYQANGNCYTRNAWADVKIDSLHAAGSVGGISGYSNGARNDNGLALGNILSVTPDTTHRAIGGANSLDYLGGQAVYAYAGQTVNSEPKDDAYQIRRLLDEDTLRSQGIWTEIIKLGTGWDYSPIIQNNPSAQKVPSFPKLRHPDTGEVLWGQDDIPLPEASSYELVVTSTEYDQPNDIMTANCTLRHPGLDLTGKTDAELNDMFKIEIDGMDMSNIAFANGNAVIDWSPDKDSTSFTVTTKSRTKALDYYRMTVTVPGGRELNAQVYYGQPFYWDIPDINVWNSRVSPEGGHGYTNENFRITGMVNFKDQGGGLGSTAYRGLRLGRLEGPEGYSWKNRTDADGNNLLSVEDKVGFAGLDFTASEDGQPWIECVDHAITRLHFKGITARFNSTQFNRERSGLILLCGGLSDLIFKDITLETVYNSNSTFGFVSRVEGHMERVDVDGLTMKRTGTVMTRTEYAGGIAATITGVMTEVNARDIEVDMPSGYMGGVVGTTGSNNGVNNYTHMLTGTFENITLQNAGYHYYTGGVVGSTGNINIDGLTLSNIKVHITGQDYYSTAGAFSGNTSAYNYQQDILVKDCKVYDDRPISITTDYADCMGVGGYTGRLASRAEPVRRIRVENTTVQGGYLTGGIAATLSGSVRDAEIVGCTITSEQLPVPAGKNPNYTMYTGGVCGFYHQGATSVHVAGVVVRNTQITGRSGVGGIVGGGTSGSLVQMENCFVAEDVVIKATGTRPESSSNPKTYTPYSNAGGLVGYVSSGYNIQHCISGATVSAVGQGAGGLIGYSRYDSSTSQYTRKITNCISAGKEIRANGGYAGGIIGLLSTANKGLEADALSNIIVATDIVGGDGKNSLWVNDISTVNLTNHDFSGIYIWENSTVNGQIARDIELMAAETETIPYGARPDSGELVEAAELNKQTFYEEHGFGGKDTWGTKNMGSSANKTYDYVTARSNWYIENIGQDGNQYFPYPAIAPWKVNDNRSTSAVGGAPENIRTPGDVTKGTDQVPSQVLELARWSDADLFATDWTAQDNNMVGIPLPAAKAEVNPAATVVYASGIDAVNVETTADIDVTLGGVSLRTDENGVASMTYNFKDDLTLNETTYKAEDLRRDTLVNGEYWYFIDQWDDGEQPINDSVNKGALRCGVYNYNQKETATVTEFVMVDGEKLTGVIHLWGNQALTEDGKIYTLNGYTATESGAVGNNAAKAEVQPFYSYRHGNSKTEVKVFQKFTLYGDKKLEQRLYPLDGSLYTISPYKNYVYDGILLASALYDGAKSSYFAVLDEEGGLTSYLSAIRCSEWNAKGIKQMSNTFNATSPIVVLRYKTGQVCVVIFSQNFVAYNSHPVTMVSLFAYARDYLTAIFAPSGETTVPHDPTYGDALEEARNYRSPEEELHPSQNGISGDYESIGDSDLSSDGLGGGQGIGGEASPGEEGTGSEETDGLGLGLGGEASGNGLSDQSGEVGEAGLPGEDGQMGEEGQPTEDGTNDINGEGGPAGPGGNQPGSAVSLDGGVPGEDGGELTEDGTGEAGTETLPETLFIQAEEGKVYKAASSGGLEAVSCGSVSHDEKSGTYSVDGKTYYPDQTAQPPKGLPEAVTLISEELHTKQLMAELGPAMVAYDPVTGQYSPYVTETLLGGDTPRKTTDPVPGKTLGGLDEEKASPEETGNSDFEVGHGLGRDLTPREQSGFALLALAAIAAFGILGVIFVREKNRRR